MDQIMKFQRACYQRLRQIGRSMMNLALVMGAAIALSSCDSSIAIVNDLDERDANEIIVFLIGHHIDAQKVAKVNTSGAGNALPTWIILVQKSDRMKALTLLNNNGLPRRQSLNLLALFEKQGLVSSEMEERIRYQAGLAEQIAGTIRKIDGVLDADVQISFPQEESLPGQGKVQDLITASVYVKHQGILDNPNSHLILKIKRLVASAIPGLDFDRVTVVADKAVFNDPMSLALNKEPDVVSVWGVRVVQDYMLRLQLLLLSLTSISFFFALFSGWLLWKISRLLPSLGGIGSIFSFTPWHLDEKNEEAVSEEPQAPPAPKAPVTGEAGVPPAPFTTNKPGEAP